MFRVYLTKFYGQKLDFFNDLKFHFFEVSFSSIFQNDYFFKNSFQSYRKCLLNVFFHVSNKINRFSMSSGYPVEIFQKTVVPAGTTTRVPPPPPMPTLFKGFSTADFRFCQSRSKRCLADVSTCIRNIVTC